MIALDVSKPNLPILKYTKEEIKTESPPKIDEEEDDYKCIDVQLFSASNEEFSFFEIFMCWNGTHSRRSLIAISLVGGFKVEQLLFFNL